jgi:DNA mismatch repair protein MutS2
MRDSLELLEWPVLFGHLLRECLTPYGADAWRTEPFLPDVDAVRAHLADVQGLKTLLVRYGDVTSETTLPDIRPPVRRLAKEGLLTLAEIRQILRTLREGGAMIRHFARHLRSESALDFLFPLLDEAAIPEEAMRHLSRYLDNDGDLRDEASPRLAELRRTLGHRRQALQRQLQAILQRPDYAPALQSQAVTEREGRLVVPVKVEYKNRLPGVIHGASASGSTLFVEPEALVALNNDMQALQADLEREVERIVAELSLYLQGHWEALQALTDALARLDRRLAAARLSRLLDANPVEIPPTLTLPLQGGWDSKAGGGGDSEIRTKGENLPEARMPGARTIDIRKARHPLLILNNRRLSQPLTIVPNDIRIGGEDAVRTLIITGPNTGGKTVLLKTLGLFAVMLRAGLHLPVAENSRMTLFDAIFADIGDQQDLAQNLSTFSAHLRHLKTFVADETDLSRALVLIDEITAGTDPVEGAALAKAVLDELYRKGAVTIATTHLGELKTEAHRHPGFMNASMAFDVDTLSPSYRLLLGVPGASNALTIAERLGLKPDVIERARAALGAPARESADLLQELETKNHRMEEELQRARAYREEAQEAWERLERERQQFEAERRQALKQFQTSMKGRLHELEERIRQWRKDLARQDHPPDLDALGGAIRQAGRQADHIFAETRGGLPSPAHPRWEDIQPGMRLFSRQLEITGEVLQMLPDSREVVLQAGILRATVPLSDLQKPPNVPGNRKKRAQEVQQKARRLDRPAKIAEGRPVSEEEEEHQDPGRVCDVRGQRADEAVMTVEKFLDNAVVDGCQAVAVVHGLGTGALKKEIRRYLAESSYVRRFYPAQATRGGDGKTIIELSEKPASK